MHKKQLDNFLKEHPPSVFVADDRVWVKNREEEREKLSRVWQVPADLIDKISDSVYRVNHNGVEQDLSVERLKPFVKAWKRGPWPRITRPPTFYRCQALVVCQFRRSYPPGMAPRRQCSPRHQQYVDEI